MNELRPASCASVRPCGCGPGRGRLHGEADLLAGVVPHREAVGPHQREVGLPRLGFGRIVVSEIEAPNILANLV